MKRKTYKAKIKSHLHSRVIQSYLFEEGFRWHSETNIEYRHHDKKYLYGDKDFDITWGNDNQSFEEDEGEDISHLPYAKEKTPATCSIWLINPWWF